MATTVNERKISGAERTLVRVFLCIVQKLLFDALRIKIACSRLPDSREREKKKTMPTKNEWGRGSNMQLFSFSRLSVSWEQAR